MGRKNRQFFKDLISSKDPKSSRRFITLIIAGLFILTCLTVLILFVALFIYITKLQGVNIEALKVVCDVLKDIIAIEAAIVLGGLGFISAPELVEVIKARYNGATVTTTTTAGGGTAPDPTTTNPPKGE